MLEISANCKLFSAGHVSSSQNYFYLDITHAHREDGDESGVRNGYTHLDLGDLYLPEHTRKLVHYLQLEKNWCVFVSV